ncbi:transcriptional regulator [Streptomyces sp. NBC_01237]|uniref:transcriptional regulator n=1 Tax=Streptomyces sp. NBC_01237 TaxID=2903790 RepID=UPI002DDC7B8F|nr:transcriptional regulator [Streptomyces sp. NBC_01237]WRZ76627.1 transcriptional regulator [Streptomyces sp. NBC_01237]
MTLDTTADQHPLAYLLSQRGMSNEAYLFRVAEQHRRMGYGQMGHRKEKASRWVSGENAPTLHTQFAMAALEKIPPEAVLAHGWPGWLLLAVPDDHAVLTAPWTTTATVHALEIAGGPVDRRKFLITTSVTLTGTVAQWSGAAPAGAVTAGGRRIDDSTPDRFERRLDELRHLDDELGSGEVYAAARTELRLILSALKDSSYSERVGRRLFGAAAEASRSAGWTAYDSGRIAAAERHYVTALRAAASADDPVVGANTLAFWAIQQYSTGNPRGAIDLIDAALAQAPRIGSARMTAMLHARACRAHARAGDARAADRSANAALDTYAHAGPMEADPACVYWFNLGETHQLLGSSALNLGNPRQALRHFQDASTAHHSEGEAYDGDAFPRGHAIYLARLAEAHLALGDIDAAVDTAHTAVARMGGVTSARGTSTLHDLRQKLGRRRGVPVVADFLNYTADTA